MRRCSSEAYSNGSWVATPGSAHPYRLERDPLRNPLVKGWAYAGRRFWGSCDEGAPPSFTRQAVQQEWRPRSCDLRDFSPDAVCRRFTGGKFRQQPYTILFVGDSFTGQLFISFVAMMRGTILSNSGSARTAPSGAIVFGDIAIAELRADAIACVDDAKEQLTRNYDAEPASFQSPPLRILFRRNEQLTLRDREPTSGFRHEYPFHHLIGPRTILVTQALAWFHTDGDHLARKLQALLEFSRAAMSVGVPPGAKNNWQKQIVIMSASYSHFSCAIETAHGRVLPSKGGTLEATSNR
mmetsp:Transcript_14019/g.35006  ORF Transcript_14019/g.35006 Transcript_14019/m.35006 type:complete len:296 (+) Transcript_14019:37-924(+)